MFAKSAEGQTRALTFTSTIVNVMHEHSNFTLVSKLGQQMHSCSPMEHSVSLTLCPVSSTHCGLHVSFEV